MTTRESAVFSIFNELKIPLAIVAVSGIVLISGRAAEFPDRLYYPPLPESRRLTQSLAQQNQAREESQGWIQTAAVPDE